METTRRGVLGVMGSLLTAPYSAFQKLWVKPAPTRSAPLCIGLAWTARGEMIVVQVVEDVSSTDELVKSARPEFRGAPFEAIAYIASQLRHMPSGGALFYFCNNSRVASVQTLLREVIARVPAPVSVRGVRVQVQLQACAADSVASVLPAYTKQRIVTPTTVEKVAPDRVSLAAQLAISLSLCGAHFADMLRLCRLGSA